MFNDRLPYDIHYEIWKMLLFDEKKKLKLTNKYFYKLWNIEIKSGKIILRYVKKYCLIDNEYLNNPLPLPLPYSNKYAKYNTVNNNYLNWNKKKVYRYYIQKYPIKHLLEYPEFLTEKTMDINKKNKYSNWITDNMRDKKRTLKDIYNFFELNDIQVEEIFNAGW